MAKIYIIEGATRDQQAAKRAMAALLDVNGIADIGITVEEEEEK